MSNADVAPQINGNGADFVAKSPLNITSLHPTHLYWHVFLKEQKIIAVASNGDQYMYDFFIYDDPLLDASSYDGRVVSINMATIDGISNPWSFLVDIAAAYKKYINEEVEKALLLP